MRRGLARMQPATMYVLFTAAIVSEKDDRITLIAQEVEVAGHHPV
jgi:hypothetical protein